MEALSIAFDTVIVGALALPWVVIAIDLFFSRDQRQAEDVPSPVKTGLGPAAAGALSQAGVESVLLFAVAYLLDRSSHRLKSLFPSAPRPW